MRCRGTAGARGVARRAPGHQRVDVVHQLAESRVEPVARMRQVDLDLGRDPAGVGGEHQDAVAHQHRLLDVVRHHQDRLDRQLALATTGRSGRCAASRPSARRARENGSSISSRFGMHDQRAREPDALAHAAGQLLRIGALEAVEADQVDRRLRPLLALAPAARPAPPGPSSTFSSTVSHGKSAKLWNTIATPCAGPRNRPAAPEHLALGRRQQARR